MSVLLEALKKAAEDKKRSLENSGLSNKAVDSTIAKENLEKNATPDLSLKDDDLDLTVQNTSDSPVEIKLSLSESVTESPVESRKDPEIKSPPSSDSKEELKSSLKLNLDNSSTQEEPLSSTDEQPKESPKEGQKASLNLVIEETSGLSDTNVLNTQPIVEPITSIKEQTENQILSDENSVDKSVTGFKEGMVESDVSQKALKKNEAFELQLVKEEQDDVAVASNKDALDPILDESHSSSEEEKITLSNPSSSGVELDKEKGITKTDSEPKQQQDTVLQTSVTPSNVQVDKEPLKEDMDSYKWSLNALPGYLKLGKKKKQKNKHSSKEGENPILVAGALSEDPNHPVKKDSIKLILTLLVFLLSIGIIFYGTLYYQEQYGALEQRMTKYNLVKTHLSEEEASSTTIAPSEEVSSHEVVSIKEGVKELPLSDNTYGSERIEDSQKETRTNTKETSSIEIENNQTRALLQPQDNTPSENEALTTKVDASVQPREESINKRVLNVPKVSRQAVDNSQIKTSNDSTPKAVIKVHSEDSILLDAYLRYEEGDFLSAQQGFEAVLAMNPKNVFAHIGLGNILASKQQYVTAMDYYQRALAAEPSSLNAFEAIANISGHVVLSSDWKNALTEMAQDHSESATLQYALGNLYAEEHDWLAAQSAYFQAVALEPDNADYLVNLAVSLDQLGKYNLAARYYTEALAFVDVEKVNFNEVQVKNRLISIRQFLAGKNP